MYHRIITIPDTLTIATLDFFTVTEELVFSLRASLPFFHRAFQIWDLGWGLAWGMARILPEVYSTTLGISAPRRLPQAKAWKENITFNITLTRLDMGTWEPPRNSGIKAKDAFNTQGCWNCQELTGCKKSTYYQMTCFCCGQRTFFILNPHIFFTPNKWNCENRLISKTHYFHILKTIRIFLNSATLGFIVILVISERVTLSSSFPKGLELFYFTFFSLQKNLLMQI